MGIVIGSHEPTEEARLLIVGPMLRPLASAVNVKGIVVVAPALCHMDLAIHLLALESRGALSIVNGECYRLLVLYGGLIWEVWRRG